VPATLPYRFTHAPLNIGWQAGRIQECDVLLPRQPNHYVQSVMFRQVQKPDGWRCIGPYGINPVGGHQPEIMIHNLASRELTPVLAWPEGSVGDSLDVKLSVPRN
jgi:hypothetical protein